MLIVFSGRPATGKTTIAKAVAQTLNATYLRIDAIEQALEAGFMTQALGRPVVADCVNPVAISRAAWRTVAARAGVPLLNIEIVCSDPAEHRRRAEARTADIAGHILPTWAQIEAMDYEPWDTAPLVIDTAKLSVDQAVAQILSEHSKSSTS